MAFEAKRPPSKAKRPPSKAKRLPFEAKRSAFVRHPPRFLVERLRFEAKEQFESSGLGRFLLRTSRFMRIHHLNCATMCPFGMSRWKTPGAKLDAMVAHCLVIETDNGLVLVDTGLGLEDCRDGKARLGGGFLAMTRAKLDESETAIRQIERLGFKASDVRHIVPTHLDLDHAGGLPDFPKAKVHIYEREVAAALARASLRERERYRTVHFAHGPEWVRYGVRGERWFGFECVRQLEGLPPEILIVPLIGHTRGHSGVAIQTGDEWLLHAGDAYFSHAEMHPERPSCPPPFAIFQRMVAIDDLARRRNQERVRLVARDHAVNVFSAHDAYEFERFGAPS